MTATERDGCPGENDPMDDFVQWFRAQLDEDDRIARAARDAEFCKDGRWTVKGPFEEGFGSVHSEAGEAVFGEEEGVPFSIAEHVARHDPARVLRETDAKRDLLDKYAEVAANDVNEVEYAHGWANALGEAVRLLALPYAGRPGYRDEWRPRR